MEKVKIWAVTEGPYDAQALQEDNQYPYDIPEDCNYFIVCKVEDNNKIIDKEFWFSDMKHANKFKNFIDGRMEATIVDAPTIPHFY